MKIQSLIVPNLIALTLLFSAFLGCNQGAAVHRRPMLQAENAAETTSLPRFNKIDIHDENHKNGIFDISVEYGDDGVGWMAYSRVDIPMYVETRLARSTDHGRTWTYVGTLNPSVAGNCKQDGNVAKGVWRYETPALVYDRSDKPARRWKLFSQRVFSKPPHKRGTALWDQSWIEYWYARSPQGAWSDPIRIFGTDKGGTKQNLNTLHRDLKDIVFYNELGSLAYIRSLTQGKVLANSDARHGD
jgi:hypothetical protein